MAIINLITRVSRIIKSVVTFRDTSFETCLSYDRHDGKRVEFVVVHTPNVSGDAVRRPFLALCARQIARNPNCTPNALLNLSMEEARLLRDFLNREETSEWLEEEEA